MEMPFPCRHSVAGKLFTLNAQLVALSEGVGLGDTAMVTTGLRRRKAK